MATHRMSILGGGANPSGGTAGAVFPEPASIKQTNDLGNPLIWIFNDPVLRNGLHTKFSVPLNYVGTPKFVVVWTSTATSGNVIWEVDYRAISGNDTESLDPAANTEALTVTDAAPGAANRRLEALLTATAGNFAAGDTVSATLFRDGSDAADTMAAAAQLWDLLFEYTDV
jgi:hypothetical protein